MSQNNDKTINNIRINKEPAAKENDPNQTNDPQVLKTLDTYCNEQLEWMILSNAKQPDQIKKVKIRPVLLKETLYFQAESFRGTQVFHNNMTKQELLNQCLEWLPSMLKQVEINHQDAQVTMLFTKKGKATIKVKKKQTNEMVTIADHNRTKKYLLEEGTKIPFMQDLGIMTAEGKVVKAKYDKFRQMNRFLEFIEDVLPVLEGKDNIRILDFGCGKSYLTFAMYYYLHEKLGRNVTITGLDLKAEVIENCQSLADRYGYESLNFLQGDIANYYGDTKVDMVVTLHACDTATDFALHRAVTWGAKVILSVPCCQHEINGQLTADKLDEEDSVRPFLKHGIMKERMAALMTDSLRAELLECFGYKVQILEFIDMSHTPKNLLIRAVKSGNSGKSKEKIKEYREVVNRLSLNPMLAALLLEDEEGAGIVNR